MSKHDVLIMPITIDGVPVGALYRLRTARQAFEERVACAEIRKQFKAAIESAESVYRVPIIGKKIWTRSNE
jgi:hypothetical protein